MEDEEYNVAHGEQDGASLEELRHELDRIDDILVDALARRVRVAERVGAVKAWDGMDAWEPRREAQIVRKAAQAARNAGIPEEGVRHVFWTVLGYCRDVVASERSRTAAGRTG